MSEPQKGIKIVFGPVHPVVEKEEIIEVPSEKAGEKKIISHIDLKKEMEEFLEIQASKHYIEKNNVGEIVKRKSEDGKVLTENKQNKDSKKSEDDMIK